MDWMLWQYAFTLLGAKRSCRRYAGSSDMKNVVEKPLDGRDAASLPVTKGKGEETEPS